MNVSTLRDYFLYLHNKSDNLTRDIKEMSKLGYLQKRKAKQAICWLLSKAPHSIIQISDHFDLSPELIEDLLKELIKYNLVLKEPSDSEMYYVASKNGSGD